MQANHTSATATGPIEQPEKAKSLQLPRPLPHTGYTTDLDMLRDYFRSAQSV